jgi:dTDP-4-dehydrorhamnose reductase
LCTDKALATAINTEVPHLLARNCSESGVRLIHVSTDCVFRGDRGNPYFETDVPDAVDTYGVSKARGEVTSGGHLTVRTSFIGHELDTSFGLLDWFLGQRGEVRGFSRHLWTGLGAVDLADILLEFATHHSTVTGLIQVAGAPVDKQTLLGIVQNVYEIDVNIIPDDSTMVDRRLDATRLASLGIHVPSIAEMVQRLHDYVA